MPQVQVVDTTERAPEPTGVEKFFSNLGKSYKDQSDRVEIGKLLNEYKSNREDANAWEDLQLGLENSTISPTKRLQTQQSLNEMRKQITERDKAMNSQVSNAGKEYGKLREKAVADYVNESITQGDMAADQKLAIAQARKALEGDITGPGFKAVLKNSPYSQLLIGLTPDESALQTANKQLLAGTKGLFGARPTEREIFLLLNNMLPSIGKTDEANAAGMDIIEKVNDMKALRSEIVNNITNGGTQYVPNIEQLVNEQMQPVAQALLDELKEVDEKFNEEPKKDNKKGPQKSKGGEILVKAPDGSKWKMTQKQIDDAKEKGTIFEPVK